MVHVPFFNVDLPEPRLGWIIPNTVGAIVQITGKALEYGEDLLHPPTPEDIAAYQREVEASFPREFDRVRKRYAEGKIVNDAQLSSEVDDASFDWYRRQLRTSVLGATDEEPEDVAARKLGLKKPSLQAAVHEQYIADAVAATGGIDLDAEAEDARLFAAMKEREAEQRRQLEARAARLEELRRQLRPGHRQAIGTLTNASGGLLLGVLLAKSVVVAGSRLFRRRKPRPPSQPRRPAPALAPQQAIMQQQRAQAAAAAAAAAAAQQQAAALRQQAASRQQPQAVQQQQQQQQQAAEQQQQAQAGAAAATGTAARKPRAVKKR